MISQLHHSCYPPSGTQWHCLGPLRAWTCANATEWRVRMGMHQLERTKLGEDLHSPLHRHRGARIPRYCVCYFSSCLSFVPKTGSVLSIRVRCSGKFSIFSKHGADHWPRTKRQSTSPSLQKSSGGLSRRIWSFLIVSGIFGTERMPSSTCSVLLNVWFGGTKRFCCSMFGLETQRDF